ncbi:DUF4011 domain-containing protein [Mariniblastus sp.]|nr:DUF4011 domain-containing protein [Mariniblastus sp.]
MSKLANQILEHLKNNPNSRAKYIASEIGCEQADVNRLLHGQLKQHVQQNDEYEWSLCHNQSATIFDSIHPEIETAPQTNVVDNPASPNSLDLSAELDRFRHRLLDLTNRNPLLNFRKSKVRTLQIVDELPNKIFERLIDQNKKFRFLHAPEAELDHSAKALEKEAGEINSDKSDRSRFALELPPHPVNDRGIEKRHLDNKLQTKLTEDKLDRVLNRISRDAQRSKEETGINYLHLTLGFIEWREKEGATKSQLAPLMLIPIAIERAFDEKQGKYAYSAVWTEEEVKFNISLAKRIENDFGLRIPAFETEEVPEAYFQRVSEAIKTKTDWRLKRECVAGFFSFHKLLMYNDLENWTQKGKFDDQSAISQLVCGTSGGAELTYGHEYSLDDIKEKDDHVKLVLDADSSQHSALLDICDRKSLVIEGPPGTGKSQTITNAIAALIAQGKSVLFVAEKLAALNVVKTKLDNLGLGEFCLELHSDGATPRSVIRSLESRIYGDFPAPKQLKEVERKLLDDKAALRDYLSASEQRVGPRLAPLHEVVWEITELRGRGLEPLFGYRGGSQVIEEEFKAGTEALDNLAHALSDLSSPNESRWIRFSADELRPNQIPRVKTILTKMMEVTDKCEQELFQLNDELGGDKAAWFEVSNLEKLGDLQRLAEFIPREEFECDRLLDKSFKAQLADAYKLLQKSNEAEKELLGLAKVDSSKFALSRPVLEHLRFLLPAYVGYSLERLVEIQETIPSIQAIATELQEIHGQLNRDLVVFDSPEWLGDVDETFVDVLTQLTVQIPEKSYDCKLFLNREAIELGNTLCQKLSRLEEIDSELEKQNSPGQSVGDELTRYAADVLNPLQEAFGDQTIRFLKRTKGMLEQVVGSLDSLSQSALKLQQVGFNGLTSLEPIREVEGTLKLYRHPILQESGPANPRLFESGATRFYQQAKADLTQLTQQETELGEFFHIPSVPDLEQLKEIQSTLRRLLVSPLRWVNTGFWRAKRQLAGFRQPLRIGMQAWLMRLESLEKHQLAKKAFVESEHLADLFGPSFKGLDTDWETISTLMRWVATVKQRGVNGDMHSRILEGLESNALKHESIRATRKQLETLLDSEVLSPLLESQNANSTYSYVADKKGAGWASGSGPKNGATSIPLDEVESKFGRLHDRLCKLDRAPESLEMDDNTHLQEAISKCNLIEQQARLSSEISNRETWRLLGDHYQERNTNRQRMADAVRWVGLLSSLRVSDELKTRLLDERPSLPAQLLNRLTDLKTAELKWETIQGSLSEVRKLEESGLPKSVKAVEKVKATCEETSVHIGSLVQLAGELGFAQNEDIVGLSKVCRRLTTKLEVTEDLAGSNWTSIGSYLGLLKKDQKETMRSVSWTSRLAETQLPVDSLAGFIENRATKFAPVVNSISRLISLKEEYREFYQQLEQLGDVENEWLELNCEESAGFDELNSTIQELIDDSVGLEAWAGFCRARKRCAALKLEKFVDGVVNEGLSKDSVASTYQLTVLENAVSNKFDLEQCLSDFTRHSIEVRRDNLKSRDRTILKLNRDLIAHKASLPQPPAGNSRGRVAEKTEMGLVLHEIGKQTRHVQIRSLLQRAGQSVKTLKPCFMMSPLSVSQFLDPDSFEFDVVIMDEASQIKPEDALGAVLRAKQLVVVGDPKQLPPTSFFDRGSEDVDEETETQFDDNESILEVAMKTFHPIRRLRWHYRSQHESLIQFSNDRFYEDDLVIFPSSSKDSGSLGVYHHYIEDGFFVKGLNLAEAEAVATAIAEHARYCPDQSLGVGTFNMKQAALILDKLEDICEQDTSVRLALEKLESNTEKLFVKNLENLQGDERDVIFISYTYGPDPITGKVYNRFGPLAGEGGWRRLNVMVSRARKRVEVFSSLKPSDINAGEGKSRGINAYRDYLEFAQSGSISSTSSKPALEERLDRFEESIVRVVEKFGLKCKRKVGVAGFFVDVGVVSPYCDDTFLLGIVADGESYRSAKSARDRDRLRDEVIQARNWDIHRIWSADWFLNQQNEERRLYEKLKSVLGTIPQEFRQSRSNDGEATDEKFSDVDICDQIVSHLKENSQSLAEQIAGDLELEIPRIERLLQVKLSPFVGCDEYGRWALKRELMESDDPIEHSPVRPRQRLLMDEFGSENPLPKMEGELEASLPPTVAQLIIQSSQYQSQKKGVKRAVVNDLVTVKILVAIENADWQATVGALSESIGIPPFRLRGMLPGLQRLLNIDGQQAMTICRDSDTVELNEALIRQEFLT